MSIWTGLRPVAVCFALFAFSHTAAAQNKAAVVNLQQAVLGTAEIKKADAEMQAKFKPRVDEAQKLQADIAAISQKIQGGKLTPQAEADLTAEGQRKQRDLQRLNEDLQGDVERERNEVLSKSSQKMQDVVRKIAEERGLDLVVDTSTTLYFKAAMDITKEVIAAYDKAYPAAAPAAPPAKK
jgi:outer membrane protein